MQTISNCTPGEIQKAAQALAYGKLVAFPTETVYGLGADATNQSAIAKIYSVKARPVNHPLIVHISSVNQIEKWAIDTSDYAIDLARCFWPGPITLILKRSKLASDAITGGQDAVGLRVPSNPVALNLLAEFERLGGIGVVAPSANRFGSVSPTSAKAVEAELGSFMGKEDLILDDGPCLIGIESTIVDCTKGAPIVLRPGAVTTEMIELVTGLKNTIYLDELEVRVSGNMASHYSPKAVVELGMPTQRGHGFIALADVPSPSGALRLAAPKSIEEYARVLYQALRLGDELGLEIIYAIEPKGAGLALAIRDRLTKAASGK